MATNFKDCKFFTVKEFAKKMNMSPYTIRRSIISGKIYAMRPGMGKKSPYRIPETEFERLMISERFKNV
jgi:excisionase family DNA binding protein